MVDSQTSAKFQQKSQEDILQSSLVSDDFSYHPNINW